MLDGWYCRSLAASEQHSQVENNEQNNVDDTDSSSQENDESHQAANNSVDYKTQYRYLKRKLKFLIYVSYLIHIRSIFINSLGGFRCLWEIRFVDISVMSETTSNKPLNTNTLNLFVRSLLNI